MRQPFFNMWMRAAMMAGAFVSMPGREVSADVFVLNSGGRIEGEWLNRDEQPLTKYEVRQGGVKLVLPLSQVKEAIRQSPAEQEYSRKAPAAKDTVEGQWELAEWCRKNGLAKPREAHLRRIVELDPNHKSARAALGYHFLKGEWITRSDARRQEGYEFYRGKWRTPQEIELLESRGRSEIAAKDWLAKLRRWRKDLDDRERSKIAYESLAAITDPIAVAPLSECFRNERVRSVKYLYADILARIGTNSAIHVIADRALVDADEEVFYYCLGKLAQLKPPHVSDLFISALNDKNNLRVNRAGTALARLQDKTAISPLIEALVTTHSKVIDTGEFTTAGFSGGSSTLAKGDGLVLEVYHVHNQPVLDALSKLTGADFGFNKAAWRTWHAQEKIAAEARTPMVNTRRD
jgi:HEAT repeat protein